MDNVLMPQPLRKVFFIRLLIGIAAIIFGISALIVNEDIKLIILCFAGILLILWAFLLKKDFTLGKIFYIDLAFIAAKKSFDSMKVSFSDSDGAIFEYFVPRKKYLYDAFSEGHSYRLYFYENSQFNLLAWEIIT